MKQRSRIHSCFALHPTTCDNAIPLFIKHCTGVILRDVANQKPRHPQQKPNSRLHSCVKHLMSACSDCFQAAKKSSTFRNTFWKWIIKLWLIVSSQSWKDRSQTVALWLAWAQSTREYDNQWDYITTTKYHFASLTRWIRCGNANATRYEPVTVPRRKVQCARSIGANKTSRRSKPLSTAQKYSGYICVQIQWFKMKCKKSCSTCICHRSKCQSFSIFVYHAGVACCFSPWDFLLHGLRRTGDGVFEVCVVCRLWALGGLPRCTVELHAVRARGCLFRGFVCLGVFEICCQVCLDQFVSDPDRSDVNGQWEFATLHTTVHQIRLKQKAPSTQEYKRPTMSKTSWHNSICKFYFVSSRETHTVWGFLRFLATWDCLPHLTPIECIGQPGHEQSAAQCRSHDGLTKTAQWFYFHFRFKPNQIYWIIYLQQRYWVLQQKQWRVEGLPICITTNTFCFNMFNAFTQIGCMQTIPYSLRLQYIDDSNHHLSRSTFGFLAKLWKGFWKPVFCNKGCPCEPMVRTVFLVLGQNLNQTRKNLNSLNFVRACKWGHENQMTKSLFVFANLFYEDKRQHI